MRPYKSLWTLGAAAPLAAAAVLAAAPQASAGVGDAGVGNAHVVSNGSKLTVDFTSAVSDQAADATEARNVAASLVGEWAGQLVDEAARNDTPQQAPTCRATATATDPNGATGTASAAVNPGFSATQLEFPDQAAGTKWGAGDLDHFTVELTCTDMQLGNISRAVIDQDAIAM